MLIPSSILAVFFSASIILALTPGPDNIFVLTQSAIRGRQTGWVITLGLCTGLLGHTFLVASGVAVIFQASLIAYTSMKLAGGAYLLYLAYLTFRASPLEFNPSKSNGDSIFQLYQRGVIMNVTNPKVSIFFLSFLPQFTDPLRGSLMLQIMILGFIFIISSLLIFGMISLFAGFMGDLLMGSSRVQKIMNRIAGTVYLAMAVKLVTGQM